MADMDTSELHKEWRGIIMVLVLVAAVNNHGHARLLKDKDGDRLYQDILDKSHSSSTAMLHGIASIFVRNHDIIAVSIFHSRASGVDTKLLLLQEKTFATKIPGGVEVLERVVPEEVVEDEWSEVEFPENHFAAIANPDDKEEKSDDTIRLSPPGTS